MNLFTCPQCGGQCEPPQNAAALVCPHCQAVCNLPPTRPKAQTKPTPPATTRTELIPPRRTVLQNFIALGWAGWGGLVLLTLLYNLSNFATISKDEEGQGLVLILVMGATCLELAIISFAAGAVIAILHGLDQLSRP